jgi:hypothetical protein
VKVQTERKGAEFHSTLANQLVENSGNFQNIHLRFRFASFDSRRLSFEDKSDLLVASGVCRNIRRKNISAPRTSRAKPPLKSMRMDLARMQIRTDVIGSASASLRRFAAG